MSFLIDPYRFNTCPADALAFIAAAGITDATQKQAICTLVSDLQTYGIWTKMKAIYPFVGGTASSHKWNLKDPRDLDAAFRLVFSGGWTHSSNGAQPNGINGYANTFIQPNNVFTLNNTHQSLYITNTGNLGVDDYGARSGTSSSFRVIIKDSANNRFLAEQYGDQQKIDLANAVPDSRGFFVITRESSTSLIALRNNVSLGTNTNTNTGTLPSVNMVIGALNNSGSIVNYASRNYAFASAGDGLTNTDATNYNTAVQAFQTTLGRQV
jgi:hypothetical protein